MLTANQKQYLNWFCLTESASLPEYITLMSKMDDAYGDFTREEQTEVESWIDRYFRGLETEDISDLGY